MKQVKAASPPPVLLDSRRARLRGRPSSLKGRGRDRYATDLQSQVSTSGQEPTPLTQTI